jgi:hypothetical protein
MASFMRFDDRLSFSKLVNTNEKNRAPEIAKLRRFMPKPLAHCLLKTIFCATLPFGPQAAISYRPALFLRSRRRMRSINENLSRLIGFRAFNNLFVTEAARHGKKYKEPSYPKHCDNHQ